MTNAFTESKNRDVKSLQRHGRRTSFIVVRARLLHGVESLEAPRRKTEIDTKLIRKTMKERKKANDEGEN